MNFRKCLVIILKEVRQLMNLSLHFLETTEIIPTHSSPAKSSDASHKSSLQTISPIPSTKTDASENKRGKTAATFLHFHIHTHEICS